MSQQFFLRPELVFRCMEALDQARINACCTHSYLDLEQRRILAWETNTVAVKDVPSLGHCVVNYPSLM